MIGAVLIGRGVDEVGIEDVFVVFEDGFLEEGVGAFLHIGFEVREGGLGVAFCEEYEVDCFRARGVFEKGFVGIGSDCEGG